MGGHRPELLAALSGVLLVLSFPKFGQWTLGWIALGFVAGGLEEWEGRTIVAASPVDEQYVPVRVVSQHFLDPEGERMHG